MSKTLIKYIFFIGTVLITSALGVYANEINGFSEDCLEIVETNTNQDSNTYSNQEHKTKSFFGIIESQEVKTEESSSDTPPVSSCYFLSNFFNTHVSNNLSLPINDLLKGYKNYFGQSTTKLYIRLRVLII